MRSLFRFFSITLAWIMLHTFLFYAQGETYIRIIAHDDSTFAQEQKTDARELILAQLSKDDTLSSDRLEQLLLSRGFPASVTSRVWVPPFPYSPADTLYITLGSGQGHNWWGVLCDDSLRWSFLQRNKNGVPSGDAAEAHILLSFPLLSRILSLLGLGQDELQIGQMGQ